MIDTSGLPGAERVECGLRDLAAGRWTIEAWLVAIAPTRLRTLGFEVASVVPPLEPEMGLYEALGQESDDPYGRYNALKRELTSFMDALESRRHRATRIADSTSTSAAGAGEQ